MTEKEQFLSKRKRYQPITLPQEFSDEEMARDWTLSSEDRVAIGRAMKVYRLYFALQLCAVRLYGRFLSQVGEISPRIINYLGQQLDLPPSLEAQQPTREATYLEYHKNILAYLGFRKFDDQAKQQLEQLLEEKAHSGYLPNDLFSLAEGYLLSQNVLLPGASVLERLVIHVCSEAHIQVFESIYEHLTPELRTSIDGLLDLQTGEQRSLFNQLKDYPPAAKISSLKTYLKRYELIADIDVRHAKAEDSSMLEYLFKLSKRYNAADIKRFNATKRYALLTCFLVETRKSLIDHLVLMHDQYLQETARESRRKYEKRHRALRKRQKKAVDIMLRSAYSILNWPDDKPLMKGQLFHEVGETNLRESIDTLQALKKLNETGYGDLLVSRYSSLRKYFARFIKLPFAADTGSEELFYAIEIVRSLDSGDRKRLPNDTPVAFVPKELKRLLRDDLGNINRAPWEMGLAFAMKDALRSGDLYLPESRRHVSFWDLTLNDPTWNQIQDSSHIALKQPPKIEAKAHFTDQFHSACQVAQKQFPGNGFAIIQDGKLRLKRDDKIGLPAAVTKLQKVIDTRLPSVRIEELLFEVDQLTGFSRHFVPIQGHQSRPKQFYQTLMACLISQATNLGVVSMSASMKDTSVDMLRHVLDYFVREETLKAASAEIVNQHHELPLSSIHGDGHISSSDAQRFKIRASSLLASYYPRYYGYYEKAIGIYTHVSDQYAVFGTQVISCSPREALYVLDGLLENNTLLKIQQHTTDTHGYTEIVFALCHLLGFYFMPRIRDLKDQQLYRVDRGYDYGVFTPLLNKTADLNIIEEQWDAMIRVALSLKKRTAPAHVIVQRLTSSFPSDRLSKAFTNLGRIIKTQYILRYLTDRELRQTVQRQLNKGEYRHKLPRRIFFADQGEFTVGDYESIMNKASSLSLVSNAVLYWNTLKINTIVEDLRRQGEEIEDETLSHISLLPFKHVIPNGTYFIDGIV